MAKLSTLTTVTDLVVRLVSPVVDTDQCGVLAITDKRYCFDYFQPLTTTGQLLEAHAERRLRHTRRLAFGHFAYGAEDGGLVAWSQHPSKGIRFMEELETASNMFATFEDSADYIDLHAWHFVPPSFELLLLELAQLGQTDWRVERIMPTECCEFFAWLRRGAASLSVEEVAARRMMLLKRTLLAQAQIDWLLGGDPELVVKHPAQLQATAPAVPRPDPQRAEMERLRQSAAALEAEADSGGAQRTAQFGSMARHASAATPE